MPRKRKSSRQPHAQILRDLATNLTLGRSEPAETAIIVNLLRALASGRSVTEGLGLTARKGAPMNGGRSQRVWDAAVMTRPVDHGGEGKQVKDALAIVAEEHAVSLETVRKDWKSSEGKAMRALASNVYDPIKLPLD